MQEQDFKLISECLDKLEGQEITVGTLNESLDSVPYPLEQKVVKTKSDISYIFADEAGDRYRIQFLTAPKYGKGVVKVYIGKAKSERMFVDKIDSFKNPRRMITSVIDYFHQHLLTPEGMQLKGFMVDLSGAASVRAIPLITKAIKLALVGKAKVVSTDFHPLEGRKAIWVVKGNLKPSEVFTVDGAPWDDPKKDNPEDKATLNNKATSVKLTKSEESNFKDKLQADIDSKYKAKEFVVGLKTSLPKHTISVTTKHGQTVTLLTVKDEEVVSKYDDILHTLSVQIGGYQLALKAAQETVAPSAAKKGNFFKDKAEATRIVEYLKTKERDGNWAVKPSNGGFEVDHAYYEGTDLIKRVTGAKAAQETEGSWVKGPLKDTLSYSVNGVIQASISYDPTGKIVVTKTGFSGAKTNPDTARVINLLRQGHLPLPDLDLLEKYVREIPTGSSEAIVYKLEQMGFRSVIHKNDSKFSVKNKFGEVFDVKQNLDGTFSVRPSQSVLLTNNVTGTELIKLAKEHWFGLGFQPTLLKEATDVVVDYLVSKNADIFSDYRVNISSGFKNNGAMGVRFNINRGNKYGITKSQEIFNFDFNFDETMNRWKVKGFLISGNDKRNLTESEFISHGVTLSDVKLHDFVQSFINETIGFYISDQKKLTTTLATPKAKLSPEQKIADKYFDIAIKHIKRTFKKSNGYSAGSLVSIEEISPNNKVIFKVRHNQGPKGLDSPTGVTFARLVDTIHEVLGHMYNSSTTVNETTKGNGVVLETKTTPDPVASGWPNGIYETTITVTKDINEIEIDYNA